MVKDTSYMFITGPDVIKTVTHEDVTKDELGGAGTHNSKSGVAHFAAENDEHCLSMTRELLSFLPSNNLDDPPLHTTDDPEDRHDESLNSVIPESSIAHPMTSVKSSAGLSMKNTFLRRMSNMHRILWRFCAAGEVVRSVLLQTNRRSWQECLISTHR